MRIQLCLVSVLVLFIGAGVVRGADGPATKTNAPASKELFTGKDLTGWKITDFGGQGEVEVKDGKIIAHEGAIMTGVQYTNSLPTNNFAISLEAMKLQGDDFFCALTFPVHNSFCSFIVGGWGGGVVGLSSIDGMDASENETTKYLKFEKNKWYKIRVEVRTDSIKAFLDGDELAKAPIKDHKITVRPGPIELQTPFGLSAYQTAAAWRNIRLSPLPAAKP
jgi:hypothetical protein